MPHMIETNLGKYIFNKPDDYIAVHMEKHGHWEPHLCEALIDVLPRNNIRGADVGANVGVFSIQMALLARERQKTICIDAYEVQPSVFSNLLVNIELNALTSIIVPHNVAIGKNSGNIEIEDVNMMEQRNTGEFSLRHDVRANFGIEIRVDSPRVKIPMIPLAGGYDFIKLDVEGMELEIVRSAEDMLRSEKPAIIVEAWSPEKAPWYQEEANELFSILRSIYANELPMGEDKMFWN